MRFPSARTRITRRRNSFGHFESTHVVLVHGETSEMARLKEPWRRKLSRTGRDERVRAEELPIGGNSVSSEKVAKVAGSLASDCLPVEGQEVRGVLVAKDFGHLLVAPEDVRDQQLRTSVVTQRQFRAK